MKCDMCLEQWIKGQSQPNDLRTDLAITEARVRDEVPEAGINRKTLWTRYKEGWPDSAIVLTKRNGRYVHRDG